LIDENGKSYIYGYVPIVVAKCGVFLKEKGVFIPSVLGVLRQDVLTLMFDGVATGVEGIFRLSGSEKRIKELKTIFDSPDRYGKGLVWEGYTVHDAANVLRRYLNDLPEPVVPLDLYERFREPLRGATKQAVGDAEGPQFVDTFDMDSAITTYQQLITELPPLNRQLLLYILDLLAVFAAKSDENRMNSQNLAAIFQPGLLSHPHHAMAPEEYRLNQCVIIFLIENQDHFLIGMQGTAADEKTVREMQKGTPAIKTTPVSNMDQASGVQRSASSASAGAESVAKDGKLRRNKSVSSGHSRHSHGAPSPGSPALATTPTTGGLGRSNTVPSKKSPALQSGRFAPRNDPAGTPVAPLTPVTPSAAAAAGSHGPPPVVEELATPPDDGPKPVEADPSDPPVDAVQTPSKTPHSMFHRSQTSDSDRRSPNKLRKKKQLGNADPSAHSSTASLTHSQAALSPGVELPNPIEPVPSPLGAMSLDAPQQSQSQTPSEPTPRASLVPSSNTLHPESAETGGHALKAKRSPPTSLHSSFNEGSDLDHFDEPAPTTAVEQPEKDKKRRWRLSRKRDDPAPVLPPVASPRKILGQDTTAGASSTSIGSGGPKAAGHVSTGDSLDPNHHSTDAPSLTESGSRESKDEASKGSSSLTGWIKHKYREAKENAEQRRNKSPSADRGPGRGKSMDIPRPVEEDKANS
jgi:hypothetical protein